MNTNKGMWVTSRRLDCVSPAGLRRTLYAGYRTEEKRRATLKVSKAARKFSLKRTSYYSG